MTLYFTPPAGVAGGAIRAGRLGMIVTPGQGNRLTADVPLWCADNGCFTGRYPGDVEFLEWLAKLVPHASRCAFVVAPDVPGDHEATWARSRDMLPRIRDLGFPAALVYQDGIEHDDEYLWRDAFDVAFIGGTDRWRSSAAAAREIRAATDLLPWTHFGRTNSMRRIQLAKSLGCQSADGTLLTRAPDKFLPKILAWSESATGQDEFVDADYIAERARPEILFVPARRGRVRRGVVVGAIGDDQGMLDLGA